MANEAYNSWSPWMKALYMAGGDASPDGAAGGDSQGAGASASQPSSAAPPSRTPPQHRIEDDRTAGTRGTTPQSTTTNPASFYVGAQHPVMRGSATLPLESQMATDKSELNRMNQPTQMSLRDRIGSVLSGAIAGSRGEAGLEQQATLRDRAEQRKFQERQSLQNRIDENARALTTAGVSEEGQNLRARMAAQAQVAAAERLGETLSSRERVAGEQIASREQVAGEQIASRAANLDTRMQERRQEEADKLSMFKTTDEYRRWKAMLDNQTKIKVANLTSGKAPAALIQTAVFAKGGLDRMNSAQQAMQRLEGSGVMGQDWAQNKLEDWIFGSGAVDPRLTPEQRQDIGQLRAALGYTSSAAMRAHTGRTSQEIYNDFKSRLGAGQDWNALRGAMQETNDMLSEYAGAASNANMQSIREGTNVRPPAQRPTGGNRITLDQFLREP